MLRKVHRCPVVVRERVPKQLGLVARLHGRREVRKNELELARHVPVIGIRVRIVVCRLTTRRPVPCCLMARRSPSLVRLSQRRREEAVADGALHEELLDHAVHIACGGAVHHPDVAVGTAECGVAVDGPILVVVGVKIVEGAAEGADFFVGGELRCDNVVKAGRRNDRVAEERPEKGASRVESGICRQSAGRSEGERGESEVGGECEREKDRRRPLASDVHSPEKESDIVHCCA